MRRCGYNLNSKVPINYLFKVSSFFGGNLVKFDLYVGEGLKVEEKASKN